MPISVSLWRQISIYDLALIVHYTYVNVMHVTYNTQLDEMYMKYEQSKHNLLSHSKYFNIQDADTEALNTNEISFDACK